MKARELAEMLLVHPEREVIVSCDADGNYYTPLADLEEASWDGESVGLVYLTEEDIKRGYTEEDIVEGESVFVIYPV